MMIADVERITDFMLLLGEDESLLADYDRDPHRVLEASGLDREKIAILLTGELDAVRAAVDVERREPRNESEGSDEEEGPPMIASPEPGEEEGPPMIASPEPGEEEGPPMIASPEPEEDEAGSD